MKTERNILIAFILNLIFSVFEFFGGVYTGSVAIMSDAMHDTGDALSIGISYVLEKKSHKKPDEKHTYGYARYSVLGGIITTVILLVGSIAIIYNAIGRIITPTDINYKAMIVFAVVGIIVNLCAAFFTRKGHSVNQKAVNLHMLEDVLGWVVVLAGAVVMHFTSFSILDPIISICVSVFILTFAVKNLSKAVGMLLEKTPEGICIADLKKSLEETPGVCGVHHIHIWTMDGERNYATMHIITNEPGYIIKDTIRKQMKAYGVDHITMELETTKELCDEKACNTKLKGYHAGCSGHKH